MKMKRFISLLVAVAMAISMLPMNTLTAFATEDWEVSWADSADATSFSNGTFADAVAAANAADSTVGYIRLSRSVELTKTAAFNPVQSLTLDINNLTLSAAATVSPVISVTDGNVTITDSIGGGSITATGGNVFAVSGGTLTLSGGAYSAASGSAVISYSGGSIVITGTTQNDAVTISFASAVSDVSTVVTLPDGWALHDADGQEVSESVTQGTTLTACAKVSDVASGTCGASGNEENVTWKITGNDAVGYTLTISGTGAMADYSYPEALPWYSYLANITSVVVGEGVTHIGDYAFAECSALKTVSLPTGLVSIGESAFDGCSSLESIAIPDSVTTISDYCFYNCSKLGTVQIGSGVATIGSFVFYGCTSLTGFTVSESNNNYKAVDGVLFSKDGETLLVYPGAKAGKYEIPAAVTTIPDLVLSGCTSLTELTVAEGNSSYSAVDGVLYDKEQTTLIACPGGKTGAVTVPEGVAIISAYAFYGCTALTTVTFHSAPQSIGSYAFYDCTGLTTLNLYAVPTFNFEDYGTFYGCTLSNITVNLMCNAEDSVAATFTDAGFTTVNKSLHADSDDEGELCDGGCGTSLHTHAWEDGVCTNGCGQTHDHDKNSDWANKDGICITCGGKCTHGGETPTYANGVCTTCGAAHDPHSYTNGICTVCGGYEPAVRVTAENYEELGFTAENYAGYLKYYAIGNAGQLYWFADWVNGKDPSANAVLTADITVNSNVLTAEGALAADTSSFKDWTPMGTETYGYSGTFDGQKYTISGLYISNESTDYVGLFGHVENGTVKNVGVVDSYFCGKNYVGGVVGQCEAYNSQSAIVENCYNTGIVSGTSNFVGGVVGYLYSDGEGSKASIENCYNTGDVSGNPPDGYSYSNYIGGVVGQNHGYDSGTATVANCYNTGNVSSSGGSYYVGGVAGYNYANSGTATIENCYYLTDCAKDGYGETQFGIGTNPAGYSTADVGGQTTGKTDVQFASGEVAYLLNGGKSTGVWKQTLGEGGDASPNFTGKTVYQSGTGYTNHEHNWSYEASGNRIQAKCNGTDCTLTGSVTITLTALGGTYDGTTAHTVDVSVSSLEFTVPEDAITYTANDEGGALTNGLPVNAGSYTATLTLGEGTDAKEAKVTYTIDPKDITDATAGTFGDLTYTGEAQTPSATVTLDGKTVTGSWSAVTNVGEESTFTASGNYTGTLTRNPGMKPKTITITGATIKDVLYNENGGYTLNVTNVTFDGATLTIGEDYTASAELAGENQIANGVAATVTVTLSNDNYSLNSNTFNGSVNIITHTHVWSYSASENVITAKCEGKVGTCLVGTVTITLKAPTSLTYDGSEKVVTVEQSLKGVFSDLTSDVKYTVKYEGDSEYSDINVPIGAGSYKATLTLGTATAKVTYTIDPADISGATVQISGSYKYSLKSGTKWFVKFPYVDPVTGEKKIEYRRGFGTKREAKAYEDSFVEHLQVKLQKSKEPVKRVRTFTDVYWEYLRSPKREGMKDSSLETKQSIFALHIFPTFGERPIDEITTDEIHDWQQQMKKCVRTDGKPFSEAYLRTIQCQINSIINYAKSKNYIAENPLADIKNMGIKDKRVVFWTTEEYERFAYRAMNYPLYYYAFEVLYWCGLREGEMLALTLADIDLKNGVISVNKTYHKSHGKEYITKPKTESSIRDVSMPSFLCDELREYKESIYELDPHARFFPIPKHTLYNEFVKLTDEAGLKRIPVHGLRHSHVSLLINRKYDIFEVSKRIGHKSVKTTQDIYGHLFDEVQKTIANDLDRIRMG